jgi:hypothetical protein
MRAAQRLLADGAAEEVRAAVGRAVVALGAEEGMLRANHSAAVTAGLPMFGADELRPVDAPFEVLLTGREAARGALSHALRADWLAARPAHRAVLGAHHLPARSAHRGMFQADPLLTGRAGRAAPVAGRPTARGAGGDMIVADPGVAEVAGVAMLRAQGLAAPGA